MKTNRISISLITLCCLIQLPCSAPTGREGHISTEPTAKEPEVKTREAEKAAQRREAQATQAQEQRQAQIERDREAVARMFPLDQSIRKSTRIVFDALDYLIKEPDADRFSVVLQFLQDIPTESYRNLPIEDRLKISKMLFRSVFTEYARSTEVLEKILKSIDSKELIAISQGKSAEDYILILSKLATYLEHVPAEKAEELRNWAFSLLKDLSTNSRNYEFIGDFVLRLLRFPGSIAKLPEDFVDQTLRVLNELPARAPKQASLIIKTLLDEIIRVEEKGSSAERKILDQIGSRLLTSILYDADLLATATPEQVSTLSGLYPKAVNRLSKPVTIMAISEALDKNYFGVFKKIENILPLLFDSIDAETLSQWQKALAESHRVDAAEARTILGRAQKAAAERTTRK